MTTRVYSSLTIARSVDGVVFALGRGATPCDLLQDLFLTQAGIAAAVAAQTVAGLPVVDAATPATPATPTAATPAAPAAPIVDPVTGIIHTVFNTPYTPPANAPPAVP